MNVETAFDSFVGEYTGKYENFHDVVPVGVSPYQCFSEAQLWANFLGKDLFTGNAINIFEQNPGQWTWERNTPEGVPPVGSQVVLGESAQNGVGSLGHTGTAAPGCTTETLVIFDQNAPEGSAMRTTNFTYDGVVGWGVPIENAPTPAPTSQAGTAETIRPAYVRAQPNTSSALAGSQLLQPNTTFAFDNIVSGQSVTENGVTTYQWYHSNLGHYVWAGNCKTL